MTASSGARARRGAEPEEERRFWLGLARGSGGALLFSLPTLMTMEMWWLGFYDADRRLVAFGVSMIPLLILLAEFSGLRPTRTWTQNVIDGLGAFAIGIATSALALTLFGIIAFPMNLHHAAGKVLVLAVPAAFGATLANSQLSGGAGGAEPSPEEKEEQEDKQRARARAGYYGELFLMLAGAIYLALTVAPTQEVIVISYRMTPGASVALVLLCIAVIHAFVYTLRFRGAVEVVEGTRWWSLLVRFTLPGYVISLLTSTYLLWTFGRLDGADLYWQATYSATLALPAGVGAASARLVL